MPLQIYKRGRVYWAKGWIEYNGRPIAGHTGEALRHLQKRAHGTG